MPTRKAEAEWEGNLAEESGRLKVGSGLLTARTHSSPDLKKANRPPTRKN